MSPEPKILYSRALKRRYCEREECGKPLSESNTGKECRHHLNRFTSTVTPLQRKKQATRALLLREKEGYFSPETKQEALVRAVCEYYNIPRALVCGETRDRNAVYARQMLMYVLCVECTHLSKGTCARFLRRDLSTFLYGYGKVLTNLPKRQKEVSAILAIYKHIKPASL